MRVVVIEININIHVARTMGDIKFYNITKKHFFMIANITLSKMGLWSWYNNIARDNTAMKIYNAVNIVLLIFVVIASFSGHPGLAKFAWFLAFVMAISYTYVFRDEIKRYLKIADSVNIGDEYYQEHRIYLDNMKKIKSVMGQFQTVGEVTDKELSEYESEVNKMKTLLDLINDPSQKNSQKANIDVLRDKGTNLKSTFRRYHSALESIDKVKIEKILSV